MEQCIALYDFEGLDDELSFKEGDIITVTAKGKDSGYWTGQVDGKTGVFPNVLVSGNSARLGGQGARPVLTNTAIALYAYNNEEDDSEMKFEKWDLVKVHKACQGSPGWWWAANQTQGATELKMIPSNFFACDIVVALFAFEAREARELSFQKGDIVMCKRRWNDGWWEGTLPNGQRGVFPANYVSENVCTTSTPLFCNIDRTVFNVGATECHVCAVNEEIVNTMLTTFEDWAQEANHRRSAAAAKGVDPVYEPLDLFESVPLLPEQGAGSLLVAEDMEITTRVQSVPTDPFLTTLQGKVLA